MPLPALSSAIDASSRAALAGLDLIKRFNHRIIFALRDQHDWFMPLPRDENRRAIIIRPVIPMGEFVTQFSEIHMDHMYVLMDI